MAVSASLVGRSTKMFLVRAACLKQGLSSSLPRCLCNPSSGDALLLKEEISGTISRPRPRRRCYQFSTSASSSSSSWKVNPVTGVVKSSPNSQLSCSYQIIVGLEIHAQLNIPHKLFSPAIVPPGINTKANDSASLHPFDAAVPGTLPVLSGEAVRSAVLAAAALKCQTISECSRFERKHYCYADLPAGYQVTQQRWPLALNGVIECNLLQQSSKDKKKKKKKVPASSDQQASSIKCRVNRIQLEQDTGKTTTSTRTATNGGTTTATVVSRVDLTRAGNALIEIVTEPDLRSSAEAGAVVQTVRQLLKHTGTCQGRMEAGQLRVDCNVNLVGIVSNGESSSSTAAAQQRSPRVEVKNLNSIKQVQEAINFEARRQAGLLSKQQQAADNGDVKEESSLKFAETRTWNAATSETELIRRKDDEEDYRFLPEPDLPPIVLNENVLGEGMTNVDAFIRQNLPELPAQAVQRLIQTYGLSEYQANVIAGDPPAIALFDTAMSVITAEDRNSKQLTTLANTAANFLCNDLFGLVKEQHETLDGSAVVDDELDHSVSVEHSNVSGKQLGELVLLLTEGTISSTMAKKLLVLLYTDRDCQGASPQQVAVDRGFQLITDLVALRQLCRNVIADHPEEMNVYRKGGKFVAKMQKLFTGKAMAASRGNAHPERLREVLLECLEEAK